MTTSFDQQVDEAIALSSLRSLPRDAIDRLTVGAVLRDVGAGAPIHREGDPPFAAIVINGLIRAYVSAPNGRMMTIRYCRAGALMGTGTVFNETDPGARGNLTALVASRLLSLRPATLRSLAETDIRVTRALLGETSARVAEYINELQATSFASLRQRLARHLLDIAADRQAGPPLMARVSQEELADAVGTVREIVVRILRDMRNEGLVRTGRGWVELLDPMRLDAETYARQVAANL
jgi:CRP/FNR family cyclic AMP-dependent transcriptional regulator